MKCFICDPSRFNVATIIKVDANLEAKSRTLINYAAVAWRYLSRLRCHPAHATDHNNFNYRHAEHSSPYRNTGTLRWTPRVKYHRDFGHTLLQGRRLTAFATESLFKQGRIINRLANSGWSRNNSLTGVSSCDWKSRGKNGGLLMLCEFLDFGPKIARNL